MQTSEATNQIDKKPTSGFSKSFKRWKFLLFKSKTGTVGVFTLLIITLIALLAPLLSPHAPDAVNAVDRLQPPVWLEGGTMTYILGTDHLGRDILTRLFYGAQVSLLVGISSVVVAGFIGVTVGLIAGYYGGFIDNVFMRIVDSFLSIPNILFALVILSIFSPGMLTLIVVLGVTNWVNYARLIRGEVLTLKEREFIKAATSIGVRKGKIIVRHLLPNVMSSFIVISTLTVATTIILETSLSFLGLGIQPPQVSWGGILADGRDYLATSWWLATFPGIAITITVLAVIFVGDWLRDVLDPRSVAKR
ncbi:ABC transporter permease [Geomicrobium sp. JCM 19039]|uniref:ABC transporter permease n=1 Tax=Geomicrobium sp. JCM 19039 TaxID=1460636 RepID=UPI00045F2FD4|nr:ABC transporter permease [Geomicrobium sp. JCM 19039]GAK14178.1 dipeptide transport system permease protein DppC [Geomicrobium sp. JCM 19039]